MDDSGINTDTESYIHDVFMNAYTHYNNVDVEYNVFKSASDVVKIKSANSVRITNNVFADRVNHFACYTTCSPVVIANNIYYNARNSFGAQNSIVFGTSGASGTTQAAPLFVNPDSILGADNIPFTADDGFNIRSTSPAINTGTNLNQTRDIIGNSISGVPDIGAYEYYSGQPVTPPATPVNGSCSTALNSCSTGILSDTPDTGANYLWSCLGSNGGTTASCSLPITPVLQPDITSPTISLASPVSGSTVLGSISLSASASDNIGVVGVQFRVDGLALGSELNTAPYSGAWNTLGVSNGSHTLTAVARDAAGNIGNSNSVIVTVNNPVTDAQAPTTPSSLITTAVSSSQINLAWLPSSDNTRVAGYYIYRNGGTVPIATVTGTAYSDLSLTSNTAYSYGVSAFDDANNRSAQSIVSSRTLSAAYTLTVTTSGAGAGRVICGSGSACPLSVPQGTQLTFTATPDSGSIFSSWGGACGSITGTSCSLIINGNASVSASFGAISYRAPVITMTSPANNSVYKLGTGISITATASDPNGGTIAKVEFYEAGTTGTDAILLSTDTTAPYAYSWTNAPVGTYTLTAKAYESEGLTDTSNGISVTVQARQIKPPKVGNLKAQAGSVILSWTNPEYAFFDHIAIYRRTDTFATTTDSANLLTTTSSTSYRDEAVQAGTTYYYSLYSVDDQENYSDPYEISFTTPQTPTPANVTVVSSGGGGGGGGGGGSGSGGSRYIPPSSLTGTFTPSVVQRPVTAVSATLISAIPALPPYSTSLSYGMKNENVRNLQIFLNANGFTVSTSGPGSKGQETNYFGPATLQALNRYKAAYQTSISSVNAITSPVVNMAPSATSSSRLAKTFRFTTALNPFTTNLNVKNLQIFLNDQGFTVSTTGAGSRGFETSYFGNATKAALIRFQEYYRTEILTPNGLTRGTGYFGPATMRKVNLLLSSY